jgi:GNAT superfamily N-acetyltransferase
MNRRSETNEFILREAIEDDIPQLSIHHRLMFEEVWEKKGQRPEGSVCNEIEQAYSRKLRQELTEGVCKCWAIDNGVQIVASGGMTIVSLVPTPEDSSSKIAYIHSIYTDEAYRGKDFATRILKEILQYCKANGIKRGMLKTSDAGRPIYERIGFVPSANTMTIFIE